MMKTANRKHEIRRTNLHILRTYIVATVFIAVFAKVYNHFGHGVESFFMNFAWIWPAIGMFLALLFVYLEKPFTEPGRVFLSNGLATLTVGFLLQGIFEIAGTNSPFIPVFFAAGAALAAVSLILLFYPPSRRGE